MGYTTVPSPTGFIAKKRDDRHSSFKFVDGADELSVLDRANIKEGLKTILTGIEKVKAVFPCGSFRKETRNESKDPADLMEFHEGSLKIAEKSGCPVIPGSYYRYR